MIYWVTTESNASENVLIVTANKEKALKIFNDELKKVTESGSEWKQLRVEEATETSKVYSNGISYLSIQNLNI